MSRIGKKPIPVADGVDVTIDSGSVRVKGKHGELALEPHPSMNVVWDGDAREIRVERPNEQRQSRALHGLTRALIANMVAGVQEPFVRKLEIQGVGYQATLNGKELALQVGFANTIRLPVPENVSCELPSTTQIVVKSCDKHAVGQFAANIRRVRPPEPYKGKGIRYEGEHVRRKAGKAFGS
ncbi:50S ribosomal protein L6 [Thalassoglobus neptunius]|uniref:Large ribosomal subunit protein uL6 n=1 Tax=Thalassoglobus neptunius TaxID=1938619 RepID=A0A5C5X266_9PLAN|nr:50S ribosomal protein L6 [Thalassoglobus neptunius]TWT57117.1 50S ribosomal protein L6 [Thalassoglobus neptunius]